MILFQSLSQTQELTSLRCSGLSLKVILAPLLLAGLTLSLLNFYIASELASSSRLMTRKMIYEISSVNPLALLQNAKIGQLKGAYVRMDPVKNGETAENLLIAVSHHPTERLALFLAKRLEMKGAHLEGEGVSLISSMPSNLDADFDHLMIENQKEASSPAPQFAQFLRNHGWKIANDHLKLSLLRVRIQSYDRQMDQIKKYLKDDPHSIIEKASLKDRSHTIQKCYSELIRRFSLGIAPFTFTLLGIAFGIQINRRPSKLGICVVLMLGALSLIAFFVGKELDHLFWISGSLFLIPHLLLITASMWNLNRINRGVA